MSFRPYKPREPGTTKEVVTRLIDAAGGVKAAAVLLHRSPSQVTAYTDPAEDDEISFDQVRRLALATHASAPAEDLAALAGGVFLPQPLEQECFNLLAAESAEVWGDFAATLLRAHADGALDRLEQRDLLKKLDALLRTLCNARSQLARTGST